MAGPALVGSAGAVSTGTSGGAVTPAYGTGESRTAGNWLILLVKGSGGTTVPTPPSGWASLGQLVGVSTVARAFARVAQGGDAAPTVAAATGMTWTAMLMEVNDPAGAAGGTAFDRNGTSTAITGATAVATPANKDTNPAEWFVIIGSAFYSASNTQTFTLAVTNGSLTQVDNGSTNTADHYAFGYGDATGNGAAQVSTFTRSATNLTSCTNLIVTLVRAPTAVGETGSGADAVGFIEPEGAETGSGTDAGEAVALSGVTETGAGADAVSVIFVYASEVGSGADAVGSVGPRSAEAGSSVDTNGTLTVEVGEAGAGSDTASSVGLTAAETGTSVDSQTVAVTVTDTETGSGADAGTVLAQISSSEVGTGNDAVVFVVAEIQSSEVGAGVDDQTLTLVVLSSDTGTGVDAFVSIYVPLAGVFTYGELLTAVQTGPLDVVTDGSILASSVVVGDD